MIRIYRYRTIILYTKVPKYKFILMFLNENNLLDILVFNNTKKNNDEH